jgi:NAD(P)H-hydrate epimerase
MLARRDASGHKGTFGTVLVVGGHASGAGMMLGAPALAARAALRAGCGRCIIAAPSGILASVLSLCPSATGYPLAWSDADGAGGGLVDGFVQQAATELGQTTTKIHAAVIGPGLGPIGGGIAGGRPERELVEAFLQHLTCPVVLDADGLTAVASGRGGGLALVRRHGRVVLTPHPGEMHRLLMSAGLSPDLRGRDAAVALAASMQAVVVAKGDRTFVATPSGGVQDGGGPDSALAVGGSGDVLAGLIGGLIAQEAEADTARLAMIALVAVNAHHAAAGAWRQRSGASAGMLASDLADELPGALEGFRDR